MKRKKVKSSNIQSIGYDAESSTLEIKFHGGGIYQYHPIVPSGYQVFMKAESLGKFFSKHIKDNPMITCKKIK